jgi:hypothetical protein
MPSPFNTLPACLSAADCLYSQKRKEKERGVLQVSHGANSLAWCRALTHSRRLCADLANSGFYDGLHFHRVISGFMNQVRAPNYAAAL